MMSRPASLFGQCDKPIIGTSSLRDVLMYIVYRDAVYRVYSSNMLHEICCYQIKALAMIRSSAVCTSRSAAASRALVASSRSMI